MSKQVTNIIKLQFRYWNCRGRVQAVRYMLEDIVHQHKNVDYKENFELLEKAGQTWLTRKPDERISGPFHTLPVLHINENQVFGQTLAIGQLLARKFDLYGKLTPFITDKDILRSRIDGIVSCAYTDVIINILQAIWTMIDFVDEKNPMNLLAKKITNDLKTLNNLLQRSSTCFYYDQTEPTIADYFVFEAFTASRDYCEKLLPNDEDYQALKKLEKIMRERPALNNYFSKGLLFKRFTGSPKEVEYMIKLNSLRK